MHHKTLGRKLCKYLGMTYVGMVDNQYFAQQEINIPNVQIDEKTWIIKERYYQEWDITKLMLDELEKPI